MPYYGTGKDPEPVLQQQPVRLVPDTDCIASYRFELVRIGAAAAHAHRRNESYSAVMDADTYPYTVDDEERFTDAWERLYRRVHDDLRHVAEPAATAILGADTVQDLFDTITIRRRDDSLHINYRQ